jgi:hypothetical protein
MIKKRKFNLIYLVFVMGTAAMLLPTTLLILIGMIPTFVAAYIDRTKEQTAGLTVGAMNAAGVLPYLIELWRIGHTVDQSIQLLADPMTLLTMYGAAAMGWILYLNIPPLMKVLAMRRRRSEADRLRSDMKELINTWGVDVAGDRAVKHRPSERDKRIDEDTPADEEVETAPSEKETQPA